VTCRKRKVGSVKFVSAVGITDTATATVNVNVKPILKQDSDLLSLPQLPTVGDKKVSFANTLASSVSIDNELTCNVNSNDSNLTEEEDYDNDDKSSVTRVENKNENENKNEGDNNAPTLASIEHSRRYEGVELDYRTPGQTYYQYDKDANLFEPMTVLGATESPISPPSSESSIFDDHSQPSNSALGREIALHQGELRRIRDTIRQLKQQQRHLSKEQSGHTFRTLFRWN
jgi:hypothetical protein